MPVFCTYKGAVGEIVVRTVHSLLFSLFLYSIFLNIISLDSIVPFL